MFCALSLLLVQIAISETNPIANAQSEIEIPTWVKSNAGWWADGTLDDDSFVTGIQFLMGEGIIVIPPTNPTSNVSTNEIPDSDGDGILDNVDACPNQPETVNQFEDADGCPDTAPIPDSDGDGILDNVDACPNQPETVNQFEDADGCPDTAPIPDSDGDGILDNVDACPNQPETVNQFEDADGCPDTAPLPDKSLTISSIEVKPQASGWGDEYIMITWTYFVEHVDINGVGFPSEGHFEIDVGGMQTGDGRADFDGDNKFTGELDGIEPGVNEGTIILTILSFIGDDRGNYVGDGDRTEIIIPPIGP